MKNKIRPLISSPNELTGEKLVEAQLDLLKPRAAKTLPHPQNVPNLDGFIYVPSAGLYIAKQRSYLNKIWNETHPLLSSENSRMPTIPEIWKYREYLINQHQDKNEAQRILDDMFKIGDWRAFHADAYFEQRGDGMYILTGNKSKAEKLEPCLDKDCFAELSSLNKQGLLTQESPTQSYVQGDNIYFWYPINEKVAGFDADSYRADLYCDWDPSDRIPALGVFACREAARREK